VCELADKVTTASELPLEWIHVTPYLLYTMIYNLGYGVPVFPCETVSNVDVLGAVEFLVVFLRLF
jgi:hypothetical protein